MQQRVCAIKAFFGRHEMSFGRSTTQPEGTRKAHLVVGATASMEECCPTSISRPVGSYVAPCVRDLQELLQSLLTTVLSYFLYSPQTMRMTLAEIWEMYCRLAGDAFAARATLDRAFERLDIHRATFLDPCARGQTCSRLSESFKTRSANVSVTGQ